MTRDDAITITGMVLNNWAKPDWTDGQTEAFVNALVPHDADYMTTAVAEAHKREEFRPPFAQVFRYYTTIKKHAEAEAHSKSPTSSLPAPVYTKQIPPWVKRWICARYLYAAFGKDQDMRVFPEHRDWAGPDGVMMPPHEWEQEASTVGDSHAWDVLRAGQ